MTPDSDRLPRSYAYCRRLHARHGRSYYLATLLLPAAKRPFVHALYGFARAVDDTIDDAVETLPVEDKAARLDAWAAGLHGTDVSAELGSSAAVLPAVRDTVARWSIPDEHFVAFLHSMRLDLTVSEYATFDELMDYVYGSGCVIGLQMLPILEPAPGLDEVAAAYARDLGAAFQLANFIRDVGEDLRRGRIYLPQESLRLFGVTREHLARGVVDAPVRRLLAYEIARCRELFRSAEAGVRLLHPTSQDCIRLALRLYGGILDEVERADYRVLDGRVAVPLPRRLAAAAPALARAYAARRGPSGRRPHQTHQASVQTTSAKPNARSSTGA